MLANNFSIILRRQSNRSLWHDVCIFPAEIRPATTMELGGSVQVRSVGPARLASIRHQLNLAKSQPNRSNQGG
jgi:hypothetical protein